MFVIKKVKDTMAKTLLVLSITTATNKKKILYQNDILFFFDNLIGFLNAKDMHQVSHNFDYNTSNTFQIFCIFPIYFKSL